MHIVDQQGMTFADWRLHSGLDSTPVSLNIMTQVTLFMV